MASHEARPCRLAGPLRTLGVRVLVLSHLTAMTLAAQSPPTAVRETPLSLQAAISRALANNLELRAVRADTGLAVGQLIGSRLRSNPALAIQYQTTGDKTAAGLEGDFSLSLTQDVPLWGVRQNRIRAAAFSLDAVRYSTLDAVRRVRRDVTASYRALLFQAQRALILDSLARVNRRIARAAQSALEQALGSEIESRFSFATWQQSVLDRDAALREYQIRQLELARLVGDSLRTVYRLTDSLAPAGLRYLVASGTPSRGEGTDYVPNEVMVDSLLEVALAQRPELRAAAAERDASAAALVAARGAAKPTLALGALFSRGRDNFEVGSQPGSDVDLAFGLGAVIGLPVLNRNQGEIAQREFAGIAAGLRLTNLRQAVERDVRVAVQRVALAATLVTTLRETILPANTDALRIAEAAFGRGQANIFQVLQVQRAYVDSTTALLEALRQYAEALVELDAALGNPLQ